MVITETIPCGGCLKLKSYLCDLEVSDQYPRHLIILNQTPAPGTHLTAGVYQLVLTATDPAGNTTTCTHSLVVECQTTYLNTEQTAECPDGETGDSVTVAAGLYSSTISQEDADAQALAAAEAQLQCCEECPECEVIIPPLNNAIYESGRDVIFAVNGGRVYKLNATTGALISEARFASPGIGDSYITYVGSTVDRLYATLWTYYDSITSTVSLYKINPDTLAVEAQLTIPGGSSGTTKGSGPRNLLTVGTILYGAYAMTASTGGRPFRCDTVAATLIGASITTGLTILWQNLVFDADANGVWLLRGSGVVGATFYSAAALTFGTTVDIGITNIPSAVAYRSSQLYFTLIQSTGASKNVLKKKSDNTGVVTTIDTGRTNANPYQIRYRLLNDRIYVPTYNDDAVVVIDPTTDTVESVKTGFDSPFDLVFTPTKVWAVQHATPGLKEVV